MYVKLSYVHPGGAFLRGKGGKKDQNPAAASSP